MRIAGWGASGGRGIALPGPVDRAEKKQRRMMSAAAAHATVAVRRAVGCWDDDLADVGLFAGVGASAGDPAELQRILEGGVTRCNPLYAFQLMNNYTLCHPAILLGIGGPNSALFSRGTATVFALIEAMAALREGRCRRCVVAGADAAAHPVTVAKDGTVDAVDAAAAVCLTLDEGPIAVEYAGLGYRDLAAQVRITDEDVVERLGRTSAAGPALGWVLACDALMEGAVSVEIRTTDPDGQTAQVLLHASKGQ